MELEAQKMTVVYQEFMFLSKLCRYIGVFAS